MRHVVHHHHADDRYYAIAHDGDRIVSAIHLGPTFDQLVPAHHFHLFEERWDEFHPTGMPDMELTPSVPVE